jgi:hypothetical protein
MVSSIVLREAGSRRLIEARELEAEGGLGV